MASGELEDGEPGAAGEIFRELARERGRGGGLGWRPGIGVHDTVGRYRKRELGELFGHQVRLSSAADIKELPGFVAFLAGSMRQVLQPCGAGNN
jgi:hypothetical protein